MSTANENSSVQVIRAVNFDLDEREDALRRILAHADPDRPVAPADVARLWAQALAAELPEGSWLALWDHRGGGGSVKDKGRLDPNELICVDVAGVDFERMQAEVVLLTVPKGMEVELGRHVLDGDKECGDETKVGIGGICVHDYCNKDTGMQVVSLLELYPVVAEGEDEVSGGDSIAADELEVAEKAARVLDHLRFFYRYLWRPWDLHAADTEDFVEDHLEHRMDLVADMEERGEEGSALWQRWQAMAMQFADLRDECAALGDGAEDAPRAMELQKMEESLLRRAEVLENAELRGLHDEHARRERRAKHPEGPSCNFVMPHGKVDAAARFMNKVVKFYS